MKQSRTNGARIARRANIAIGTRCCVENAGLVPTHARKSTLPNHGKLDGWTPLAMKPFRVMRGKRGRSKKARTFSCEGTGCGQTIKHSTRVPLLSVGFMVFVPNERPGGPDWPMFHLHGPLARQSQRVKSCCPPRGVLVCPCKWSYQPIP